MASAAEGVKWCREMLGLTQLELADQLGVSGQTVWLWESDRTEPTQGNLRKLCELADISVAKFWRVTEERSA